MYKTYMKKIITLMKEINEELNKWRHFPRSWTGTCSIIKMSILSNLICRFKAILPKMDFHILGQNCFESKIFGLEVKWSLWSFHNGTVSSDFVLGEMKSVKDCNWGLLLLGNGVAILFLFFPRSTTKNLVFATSCIKNALQILMVLIFISFKIF